LIRISSYNQVLT